MTEEEIVKLAAKVGANSGVEAYQAEHNRYLEGTQKKWLHNTELLLRNYRTFRVAAENAVFRAEECESLESILLDIMQRKDESTVVESIKKSAARTRTIVEHTERMLGLYHDYCYTNGTPEDQRRWRVIDGLYLQDKRMRYEELAAQENVDVSQISRDKKHAIQKISAYMFGVDFVAFR